MIDYISGIEQAREDLRHMKLATTETNIQNVRTRLALYRNDERLNRYSYTFEDVHPDYISDVTYLLDLLERGRVIE